MMVKSYMNMEKPMKNGKYITIIGGFFLISNVPGFIMWYFDPKEKISIPIFLIVIIIGVLVFLIVNFIYGLIKLADIPQNEQKYFSSKKAVENFYKFISINDYKKAWDLLDEKQYLKEKYNYEKFSNGFKNMKSIHNVQINIVSYTNPLQHIYYVSYVDEFELPIIDNFRIIEARLIDLFHELERISKTEFFEIISDIPLRYFFLLNRDELLTFTYPKLQQYIISSRARKIVRGFEITLIRKNKTTKNWKILKLSEISPLLNY
jgi:hypothetical protein